ncbi:MAG: TetR family transcriptional regulator, partial [Phenylobacterium sp.]|nr:TetR family transcriptional regulator [Phenylobacterium sp.]
MAERNAARATDRYERKREDILDAATLILNQKGVKGLTLSLAAGAVGLSTTSVTYYFKRKDDLAAACLMRGVDWLIHLAASAEAGDPPAALLEHIFDLHLERLRLTAIGLAPPLPALSDIRALSQPRRSEVFAAYMKAFRRMRQIFEAPELASLTRGRRTARTHMLLEQISWAAFWLPK